MMPGMSEQELRGLPVTVDLETAGRAFGLGRTKSHEMVRAGKFPCQVLRLGNRYRVRKADILREVGMPEDDEPPVARPKSAAGNSVPQGPVEPGRAGTPVMLVIRAVVYHDAAPGMQG
jgi:hypothetical protein